jgi:hypothetical protein
MEKGENLYLWRKFIHKEVFVMNWIFFASDKCVTNEFRLIRLEGPIFDIVEIYFLRCYKTLMRD